MFDTLGTQWAKRIINELNDLRAVKCITVKFQK